MPALSSLALPSQLASQLLSQLSSQPPSQPPSHPPSPDSHLEIEPPLLPAMGWAPLRDAQAQVTHR